MKRILIAALAASLLVTGLTACGKKKDESLDYSSSRVLYTDTDAADSDSEDTEAETDEASDTKSKDEKTSDSDKKADSKKESSKAESKKSESKASAAASASASSKKVKTYAVGSTKPSSSAAPASSKAASTAAPSSETTSSEKSSSTSSETETDKAAQTDTEAEAQTDTAANSDADSETDAPDDVKPVTADYDLRLNTGEIYIDLGDDIDFVTDKLGEAVSVTTVGACLGGGEIKLYSYSDDGFDITAYPTDETNSDYKFATITITAADVNTERGVHLGMPIDEALKLYGSDYETLGAATYKYKDANGSYIMISADNDIVSEIVISKDTTAM